MAKLIAFEGGEGGGKSTAARALGQWLTARGVPAINAVEPGGTAIGRAVRGILLDPSSAGMVAEAEFFLYQASRAQLVREVVRPALASGSSVILDRCWLSTLAYQCAGRGLPEGPCWEAIEFATGGLMPDVTILLDVEVGEGLRRTGIKSGGKLDRLEQETRVFHTMVREGFLTYGEALFQPLHVVDTTHIGPEEVFTRVRECLRAYPEFSAAVS